MIPKVNDGLANDFIIKEIPTTTNKLNIASKAIRGLIKDLEAMKQAIFLILSVERYKHEIYSWNYGMVINDLIGKPTYHVISELEMRITEALMQDTRIKAVGGFLFTTDKKIVTAKFTVSTIYGDIKTEKTVSI